MRNSYFNNRERISDRPIPFTDRPKAAREFAGLTQDDLAYRASAHDKKLSVDLIRAIEQGKKGKRLTKRTAEIIAELCGVRFEWLTDPEEKFMTKDEIDRYNTIRDLQNSFLEYNDRVKDALSDGFHFLVWIALQRLRNEYEILPVDKDSYQISKGAQSITIKETEIKEDLYDYAEFKLRKLIKSRLCEDKIPLSQTEKNINSFFQMNDEVK